MIETLRLWCENLIIATILVMIIEMILPDGTNKKYIKVIIGIYLMFVVFDPLIKLLNNDFSYAKFNFEENIEASAKSYDDVVKNVYISGIESAVKNDLNAFNLDLKLIRILFDESYENILKIEISLNGENVNIDELINLICKKYNVEKDIIYIHE